MCITFDLSVAFLHRNKLTQRLQFKCQKMYGINIFILNCRKWKDIKQIKTMTRIFFRRFASMITNNRIDIEAILCLFIELFHKFVSTYPRHILFLRFILFYIRQFSCNTRRDVIRWMWVFLQEILNRSTLYWYREIWYIKLRYNT